MRKIDVKKGRVKVCGDQGTVLAARSLGSCLAVCIHDPGHETGGMAVIPLPEDPEGLDASKDLHLGPGSALKALFNGMQEKGAGREGLKVCLVGAARYMEEPGTMDTGKRVYKAVRKILLNNGIRISGEHVGGPFNRSLEFLVDSGMVKVDVPGGREIVL